MRCRAFTFAAESIRRGRGGVAQCVRGRRGRQQRAAAGCGGGGGRKWGLRSGGAGGGGGQQVGGGERGHVRRPGCRGTAGQRTERCRVGLRGAHSNWPAELGHARVGDAEAAAQQVHRGGLAAPPASPKLERAVRQHQHQRPVVAGGIGLPMHLLVRQVTVSRFGRRGRSLHGPGTTISFSYTAVSRNCPVDMRLPDRRGTETRDSRATQWSTSWKVTSPSRTFSHVLARIPQQYAVRLDRRRLHPYRLPVQPHLRSLADGDLPNFGSPSPRLRSTVWRASQFFASLSVLNSSTARARPGRGSGPSTCPVTPLDRTHRRHLLVRPSDRPHRERDFVTDQRRRGHRHPRRSSSSPFFRLGSAEPLGRLRSADVSPAGPCLCQRATMPCRVVQLGGALRSRPARQVRVSTCPSSPGPVTQRPDH